MIVLPPDPRNRSQAPRRALRGMALAASWLWGGTLVGAEQHASVAVACAVRLLPRASAGYDLSLERHLQGQVESMEAGVLRLRLKAGLVRVELGPSERLGGPVAGTPVAVIASLRMVDGRQHLVAREVREVSQGGQRWVFRDERGVPVPQGSTQL